MRTVRTVVAALDAATPEAFNAAVRTVVAARPAQRPAGAVVVATGGARAVVVRPSGARTVVVWPTPEPTPETTPAPTEAPDPTLAWALGGAGAGVLVATCALMTYFFWAPAPTKPGRATRAAVYLEEGREEDRRPKMLKPPSTREAALERALERKVVELDSERAGRAAAEDAQALAERTLRSAVAIQTAARGRRARRQVEARREARNLGHVVIPDAFGGPQGASPSWSPRATLARERD